MVASPAGRTECAHVWMVGVWTEQALESGDEPFEFHTFDDRPEAEKRVRRFIQIYKDFSYEIAREDTRCWVGRSRGGQVVVIQAVEIEDEG